MIGGDPTARHFTRSAPAHPAPRPGRVPDTVLQCSDPHIDHIQRWRDGGPTTYAHGPSETRRLVPARCPAGRSPSSTLASTDPCGHHHHPHRPHLLQPGPATPPRIVVLDATRCSDAARSARTASRSRRNPMRTGRRGSARWSRSATDGQGAGAAFVEGVSARPCGPKSPARRGPGSRGRSSTL